MVAKRFFVYLTILILFIGPLPHRSYATAQDSSDISIRILSWNIFCLPAKAIYNPGAVNRAPHIGRLLSKENFDVIVFQEAFHPKARKIIKQFLDEKYPYQIGPITPSTCFKTNDGVWILSKWPMRYIGSVMFDMSLLPDWFSRRGATLVEIEKKGFQFQVLGTHLQSGAGFRRDTFRLYQAYLINRDLLTPFQNTNLPLFLCGDFNTNNLFTIDPMLSMFEAERTPLTGTQLYTWPMPGQGKEKKVLDHIWFRDNGCTPDRIVSRVRSFSHPYILRDREKSSLSDHFAVEVWAKW